VFNENFFSIRFVLLFTLTIFIFGAFISSSKIGCCIVIAQEIPSFSNDSLSFQINQTALSLIPLMIKEMQNTNATDIPIRQVINATPSSLSEIQNMSIKNMENNTTGALSSSSNEIQQSQSNRTEDLIPLVVNLTRNTNATDIPIRQVINATQLIP
jgi:hypothetical protein